MLRRWTILVALLGCLLATPAAADPGDIAHYDLSLLGYRAGMSYDEAAAVRPIQRLETIRSHHDDLPLLEAYIDNLQVEEFDLNLKLEFLEGRLTKVVARVSPLQFEELYRLCAKAYGRPENRSRTIDTPDGSTLHHTTYVWDFPGAKIFLLQSSRNQEFATFSLLARPRETENLPAGPKVPQPAT